MIFKWLSGDWNSDARMIQITPNDIFPVDKANIERRKEKVLKAIEYLGNKYCLRRTPAEGNVIRVEVKK